MGARAFVASAGGSIVLALAVMPVAAYASSDVETVTTTADLGLKDNPNYCGGEGPGSEECPLRAALESAASIVLTETNDVVISVPEGHYMLNPSKGALPIGNANAKSCLKTVVCPVTLLGAGAGRTVIDGQGGAGILAVLESAGPVTVEGVTLTGGSREDGGAINVGSTRLTVREAVLNENLAAAIGGAIYATDGPGVTLIDSAITGNRAALAGGVYAHKTPLTVVGSSVSGNHALSGPGGGIEIAQYSGAGNGTMIVNSTISGNSAGTSGGGISANPADLELRYSTVAGNTAAAGGGIDGGLLTLEGSILAGDSPTECTEAGAAVAVGSNVVFGSSSCVFTGPAPLGVDPKLGPLSANGGLGQTLPLLSGSPALNAGGVSCTTTDSGVGPIDERGVLRPQGSGCDLGAFESAADAAVTLAAAPDPVVVGGSLSLTANVADLGAEALTGVVVTIPVPSGTAFISAPTGCTAAFSLTTTVICALGPIAAGQVGGVSIAVRPERAGALSETASVSADQGDYNPTNDTAITASVAASAGGPAAGGSGGTTGPPGAATSTLIGRLFKVDAHGNVVLRVTCSAAAAGGCHDVLALYSNGGTLPATVARRKPVKATLFARAHVTINAGTRAVVRLHLNAKGLRLARARRRFAARLLLSLDGGANRPYGVTLRRAAAPRP